MPETPCRAEAGASEPASPAAPAVHVVVVNPLAQAVANEPERTDHNDAPKPPRTAVKAKMKLPRKKTLKEAATARQLKRIIARMLKGEVGMRVVMWKGAMQEEMALQAAAAEGEGIFNAVVLEPQPSAAVLAPKQVAAF